MERKIATSKSNPVEKLEGLEYNTLMYCKNQGTYNLNRVAVRKNRSEFASQSIYNE